VTLYELAFGCWIYGVLTGYDSSVAELRKATGGHLDPYNPEHRKVLFEWLNKWGCRQFSKAHHDTVAGRSLDAWASKSLTTLPADGVALGDVNDAQIGKISAAYDDLRIRQAGTRTLAAGSISHVTYGPIGAAKTLFALRPNICPPWDRYTLDALGLDYSRASYGSYLQRVLSELQAASIQAGVQIAELPELLGRPMSTPPKLVDEYYWVTVTRRFNAPSPENLRQWLTWANLK
jgi:hypothetical protein